MENVERGWQATTRKVRDRLKHVIESMANFPADVHFKVGRSENEQEMIGAHKLIMASGSDVLYAMLYGSMAETGPTILITDLHPDAFRQMIRFLYTDQVVFDPSKDYADNVSLAFRTMECARKYDIPELYFACRSWLVKKVKDHDVGELNSICCAVLIEAIAISDPSLADIYYHEMAKYDCCLVEDLDVEILSNDVLCRILSKEDAIWSEKELYELCLRWANFHCGAEATPEQLRQKLNAACFLVRYSRMTPTEISDGPAKTEILTSDEVKAVFIQMFASDKDDKYPFDNQERKNHPGWFDAHFVLPFVVCSPGDYAAKLTTRSTYQISVKIQHVVPSKAAKTFIELLNSRYPFKLAVDEVEFETHPAPVVKTAEQAKLIQRLSEKTWGAPYVTEGDVALTFDQDLVPTLHVVTASGFTPAGWVLVARIYREEHFQSLTAVAKSKKAHPSSICLYYSPVPPPKPAAETRSDSESESD